MAHAVPYEGASSGAAAGDEITKLLRRFGCESVGFMPKPGQHQGNVGNASQQEAGCPNHAVRNRQFRHRSAIKEPRSPEDNRVITDTR